MTVSYLGSLTVGAAMPGAVAAIDATLPDLQARMAALASFAPSTGSFSANLSLANQIVASIQAAITAGIEPPSIDAQLAAVAALIADLEASLSFALEIVEAFGVAGIHAYRYSGQAGNLGTEFQAELSGGFPGGTATDATNGILLATTVPAAFAALAKILKVTP